jgi:membrane fusion protein, copper/silver efflux system
MKYRARLRLMARCCWFVLWLTVVVACSKPSSQTDSVDYWTCGMHPSVHAKAPGKCPICGMDLVPVVHQKRDAPGSSSPVRETESRTKARLLSNDKEFGPGSESTDQGTLSEFTVPVQRQQQIGVTYAEVLRKQMVLNVRSVGVLEVDQGQIFECVTHVDGYIEALQVASPGERVVVGQPLLTLYTPDIRSPEQELVNLLKVQSSGSAGPAAMDQLIDAARRRLQLLGIDLQEISQLERTGQPTDYLVVRSNFDGVVSEAPLKVGMGVKHGDKLMGLVQLSRLWLRASFYENEISLLREGEAVKVTLPAFPDRCFEGRIGVISPNIDPTNHTGMARIDIPNSEGQLRPGMFANVMVEINAGTALAAPFDSVLPTGSRMLVFVDRGSGKLEPRFIEVGRQFVDPADPERERYYQITAGLKEGERVVARANFLIDAEAQIQGAIKDFDGERDAADPETTRSMTRGL